MEVHNARVVPAHICNHCQIDKTQPSLNGVFFFQWANSVGKFSGKNLRALTFLNGSTSPFSSGSLLLSLSLSLLSSAVSSFSSPSAVASSLPELFFAGHLVACLHWQVDQ